MNPIISIAQTHIQFGDTLGNFSNAIEMIHAAAQNGSSLIVFPELWTSGYDYAHIAKISDQNIKIIDDLSKIAQKLNINIGGSYALKHNKAITNTFIMIDPAKGPTGHYEKIHLFKHLKEDQYFTAGTTPLILEQPIAKIGVSICYDLRFPEFYRFYTRQGVLINIISAEWPTARQAHWNTLLAARAVENQCYIIAANSVGATGNITFAGQSQLVDPWGNLLAKASATSPELIYHEIDLEELARIRKEYPFQDDTKFSLFS